MSKKLTGKQAAVLDDIFLGELDERGVLERHKISRNIYNKWLGEERFREEFDRRIESAYRQSEALVAKYAALAAAKLVSLTESEKEETARKACLDIMSLPRSLVRRKRESGKKESEVEEEVGDLCPETASKLLSVLAEEKRRKAGR